MTNLASFNTKLTTPTGPTKSVVDPGRQYDPLVDAIGAASAVADGVADVYKAYRGGQDARAKAARTKIDNHQKDVKFADYEEDRATKDRDGLFEDRLDEHLRRLDSVQSSIKQGNSSAASLRIETEKTVSSVLAEFPEYSSELNTKFQERGLSHLILGELEDQKSAHENARETREAAQKSAVQLAYSRGLATDATPYHEAVSIGQEVSATEATLDRLQEQIKLIQDNKRLSLDEQESGLEAAQREVTKEGMRAARRLSGAATGKIINGIKNVNSAEDFSALQASAATDLAALEEERMNIHELVGYDKDAMKMVDDLFNRKRDFVEDMLTGDLSYAKQQANKLSTLKTQAKLNMYDAFPAMIEIDAWPTAISEKTYTGVGMMLADDDDLIQGFTHMVSDVHSRLGEQYKRVRDAVKNETPLVQLSVKDAKKVVKVQGDIKKTALGAILSPSESYPKEKAIPEFLSSQKSLLEAYNRTTRDIKDSHKDLKAGTNVVLSFETVTGLEAAMANPATEVLASNIMQGTRKSADKALRTLMLNTSDSNMTWKTFYNPTTSRFEFERDEEALNRINDALARPVPGAEFGMGLSVALSGSHVGVDSNQIPIHLKEKTELLNQTLDFLVATREHDKALGNNPTESEYRYALATGDYSKLDVVDPASLTQSAEQALEGATATSQATLTGVAMTSSYRTKDAEYHPALDGAAQSYQVPPALLHAMADQETGHLNSSERASVTNKFKARGLMQITPIAAKELDVDWETMTDPKLNAQAGAEYMSYQLENFNGDLKDALLAYNAGPTKVRRWIRNGRPIVEGRSWQSQAFPYAEKILERIETTPTADKGDK